jgi:hypothetical protein
MKEFPIANLADTRATQSPPLKLLHRKKRIPDNQKTRDTKPDAVAIDFILTGQQYQNRISVSDKTLIVRMNRVAGRRARRDNPRFSIKHEVIGKGARRLTGPGHRSCPSCITVTQGGAS